MLSILKRHFCSQLFPCSSNTSLEKGVLFDGTADRNCRSKRLKLQCAVYQYRMIFLITWKFHNWARKKQTRGYSGTLWRRCHMEGRNGLAAAGFKYLWGCGEQLHTRQKHNEAHNMRRRWRNWIFFHLFLVVCKGVLRHRCALTSMVAQYLRWVREVRWRLLCIVCPQLCVFHYICRDTTVAFLCILLREDPTAKCDKRVWQHEMFGGALPSLWAVLLPSLSYFYVQREGACTPDVLARYFFPQQYKKWNLLPAALFCLNNWGVNVHKTSKVWMRFLSTESGMGVLLLPTQVNPFPGRQLKISHSK